MLRLVKQHGVGIDLIGMSTIDAMEPLGQLDVGMKAHFLKTKDARYTPAWIWGLSDMRALTAAFAEPSVFQPRKAIATGASKRGVGAAAAGIADDRFTAILPVVAPILDPPGGPYVEGTAAPQITRAKQQFLEDLAAGKINHPPVTVLRGSRWWRPEVQDGTPMKFARPVIWRERFAEPPITCLHSRPGD
jgi:hypothetical protein